MSPNCDIISIENVSLNAVESILLHDFGLNVQENKLIKILGIRIDIQNLEVEFQYARRFLEAKGLQEEHPFYREFDMQGFNVVVNFCSHPEHGNEEFRIIFTDYIGKFISKKLKTRVVVAFEDGDILFCIYENGIKTRDLKEHYENYFRIKCWLPCGAVRE